MSIDGILWKAYTWDVYSSDRAYANRWLETESSRVLPRARTTDWMRKETIASNYTQSARIDKLHANALAVLVRCSSLRDTMYFFLRSHLVTD